MSINKQIDLHQHQAHKHVISPVDFTDGKKSQKLLKSESRKQRECVHACIEGNSKIG